LNLRQQIIDDRVKQMATQLSITEEKAFSKFVYSLIVGKSIFDIDDSDFVDGGGDKQIDIFSIDDSNPESPSVFIIQVKNGDSFSTNELVKLKNGLEWVFEKSLQDVNLLVNEKLKSKIIDYRNQQMATGPSNINFEVYFVTRGLSTTIASEFKEEEKTIKDKYDNQTFSSFNLNALGADELVDMVNTNERKDRKVNPQIKIKYDANNPSLIRYQAGEIKGLVCTTTADEIAKIIDQDSTGFVFDQNIRRFLGTRGSVNAAIMKACTSEEESKLFWFLNNGVTIVCDSFDPVTDPDNPIVKVSNMQIVNGCQTASTLALAYQAGKLRPETRVLLRIYQALTNDLVDKIVQTTNNQNKITNRNLKANDPIQVDMEAGFARYKYFYERKPNQYKLNDKIDIKRILTNEFVAQSYLGVILKKSSDARRRKYKVWGEMYDQIFKTREIEIYLLSTLVCKFCSVYLGKYKEDKNEIRKKLANNGLFHIARITNYLWNDGDAWMTDSQKMRKQIEEFEKNNTVLNAFADKAIETLKEIIESKDTYLKDIDSALKSGSLDGDIESFLHQERTQLELPRVSK
jgi:hypothetical protein